MALTMQLNQALIPKGCSSRPGRPIHAPAAVTCRCASERKEVKDNLQHRAKAAFAATVASATLLLNAGTAHASGKDVVSEFAASGLLFKDTVEVTALEDPEIQGVTIYFTDFKRNIVDKLSKDFFSEPSQASLTCAVTGPVTIRDIKRISSYDGSELFSEQKGLNIFKNKTLRVRRVFDADRRTVIYVAYSTRLSTAADEGGVSTGRYRTSLCAVALPPPAPAPALVAVGTGGAEASVESESP